MDIHHRVDAKLRGDRHGSQLAAASKVLFAVFLISLLVAIGVAVYAGGAVLGARRNKLEVFVVPPPEPAATPYVSLPSPPSAPVRVARGTTPPPAPTSRAESPNPPGVISNREDATDPDIPPDARFSIRRSRPRL